MLNVLYEDNHLLVVIKPAGLVTQGAAEDEASVVTLAKEYLRRKYNKPGNVYLGVVSRLDAAVSGVLVLARTSKAADRLTEQFRTRAVEKRYWGVVSGRPEPVAGELRHWLVKDETQRKVVVTRPNVHDATEAVLRYRTLGEVLGGTWLEIELETGRKHQIRVQLAASGWPLLGDVKYGNRLPFEAGIALHARSLMFEHPVRKETLSFSAPLPASWDRFKIQAGDKTTDENLG